MNKKRTRDSCGACASLWISQEEINFHKQRERRKSQQAAFPEFFIVKCDYVNSSTHFPVSPQICWKAPNVQLELVIQIQIKFLLTIACQME